MDHRELKEVHLPLMNVVRMHYARYPALRGLIHVPQEGKRTQAQGGILVGMGMRKGAHDLLLLRNRRGYAGLSMELKAPGKLRKPTDEQVTFAKELHAEGWLVAISDDPASAWNLLRWYVDDPCHSSRDSAVKPVPAAMLVPSHLLIGPRFWGVDS